MDCVESAAIRAEAPLAALSLAVLAGALSVLATLCFFGTGALASFTGAAAGGGMFPAAAGGVAGILASGVICAGWGAGCAAGGAGRLLAATTGLGCMERPAEVYSAIPAAPIINATATAPTIFGMLLGAMSSGCLV